MNSTLEDKLRALTGSSEGHRCTCGLDAAIRLDSGPNPATDQ